ncbi:hypothetical protein JG688_00014282 [Phytophthora aleatoria]|uniref:ZSWIM1/3 RNaseH-like domain-containing protein n=1 Tax=Phytophthora aleatoria TaxID=2496075 RepID=A0A8J5M3E0_9STRA|nr:hypothetical protein JG688_00014282 [Phytophthora aleatoria]
MDNSSVLVHAVCFQTACQKRLFKAFPEVALVDTIHGTNKNYYKLLSILVDDVFGKVLRVAGFGYCVPVVPINRLTQTGPIRSRDDYGTLFTPPMIRRVR